jgi:outer membrane protein assembly factor BamB
VGRKGVYVADANGVLYCINPKTGELQWQADLGSQVATGILAVNGRVYVPTRGGNLMCFEEGELDRAP